MGNRLRSVLIAAVIAVWGINYLASLFIHGYEPPAQLDSGALTIVGALVATYRRDNGDEDDE